MLGILFVDIDYFKQMNDSYGHGKGDECIKAVADSIRECMPGEFAARYGGDEFVKVQNNVYDKSEKIILTKNEVADTYATKTDLLNKVQVVSNINQATTNNILYLVLA